MTPEASIVIAHFYSGQLGIAGLIAESADSSSRLIFAEPELGVAIHRLLQNTPLGPEEIERLVQAYERTLEILGLKDRNDPLTQIIARKIFEIGQTGIRAPRTNIEGRPSGTRNFTTRIDASRDQPCEYCGLAGATDP